MSEGVQDGASLPEGIDVDDTAAYFGVIESSDVLQQLMEMDSKQALSKTLEHLSDVVLQPGEFNFAEISSISIHICLVRINTLYKQDEGCTPIELCC
mgnify:CR=1 FL=1